MSANYYSEHLLFIESARKILSKELVPHLKEWENTGNFPNSVFRVLGDNGLLGILLPEKYGGSGGDYKLAGAWCETFGDLCAVGLTTAVNMHSLVISHAISLYGTDAAKDRWLPRAATGEVIGAYAFTEPGAGSDLASLRTKAERKNNRWIINGAKTFITNGARADFILVLTRTDPSAGYQGFTTFVIDTKSKGFKVNRKLDKLGWRSSDTAEITFENVEADDSCVLGKVGEGWPQAARNLNWERLMLTLTSLAGMRACLRESVQYLKVRSAFGRPLIEFELSKNTLQQIYSAVIQGEALCHHALDLLTAGRPCRAEVSVAKRLVCDRAVWVADRAIQFHGGYGYTTEFNAERWWRDLRLMPIGGGTSEIMAEIVAKELGFSLIMA